jgi:hypothetical protein
MTTADGVTDNLALDAERVPPRIAARSKASPGLIALGAMSVVAAGAVLFWFNPAQYRLYPFCFFHELTGLNCPGCGGTRALHQLLHGNVAAAFRLNALVVVSLPFFAWLGIRFSAGTIRQQPMGKRVSSKWFWALLALAVVFAVLRNLPAFAWLSP